MSIETEKSETKTAGTSEKAEEIAGAEPEGLAFAERADEAEMIDADQQAMIDEWEQMAAAPAAPAAPAPKSAEGDVDFATLMDIPLEITVEVGSASMSIEELLGLTPKSVIELDKFISDPVDIRVNGRLIAKGELYTVDENFAIKITAIMTTHDRMKLVDEPVW